MPPNWYSAMIAEREDDLVAQVWDAEDVREPGEHRGLTGWCAGCPAPAGDRARTGGAIARSCRPPPRSRLAAAFENPCAETLRRAADRAAPRTLTRSPFRARPCSTRTAGVISSRPSAVDRVEVDGRVRHAERVREPAAAWARARGSAAGRPRTPPGSGCAPSGPWCRGPPSCRPCPRCRDRRYAWRGSSPSGGVRSWSFMRRPPPP